MPSMNNNSKNYYTKDSLRSTLWLLFHQESMWSRSYLVSKIAHLDDTEILSNRLYETAMGLSYVFSVYFGPTIANKFEQLLRNYIHSTILYIDNIQTGNSQLLLGIRKDWENNGTSLAYYISSLLPTIDSDMLKNLFLNHIDMIIHQAEKRLNKDYVSDVSEYDLLDYLTSSISDVIWQGFMNQFYSMY